MAFAGNFGASGALIPFGICFNLSAEQGAAYDPVLTSQLRFERASTSTYTPTSINTLILDGGAAALGAAVAGAASEANADCGLLVSDVPAANQNGLPANFGPGRGNWTPADALRIRVSFRESCTVVAGPPVTGPGSVVVDSLGVVGGNISILIRNQNAVALTNLNVIVEYLHSIQG